jgi:hypothetical protein
MAWDASRPVPWGRLMREWLIYAGIMAVIFAVLFRDSGMVGIVAGLLLSLPLYLGLGWVLAKLGYSRPRLRRPTTSDTSAAAAPSERPAERNRPAPTRRTSTGPSHRPRSARKRR